jgi:hypothetical protein
VLLLYLAMCTVTVCLPPLAVQKSREVRSEVHTGCYQLVPVLNMYIATCTCFASPHLCCVLLTGLQTKVCDGLIPIEIQCSLVVGFGSHGGICEAPCSSKGGRETTGLKAAVAAAVQGYVEEGVCALLFGPN